MTGAFRTGCRVAPRPCANCCGADLPPKASLRAAPERCRRTTASDPISRRTRTLRAKRARKTTAQRGRAERTIEQFGSPQPADIFDEGMHHPRHAFEGGEGAPYRAAGRVGSGQSFRIDVFRRLLVEPHPIERLALPALATLVVALERRSRDAACYMLDQHVIQKIGHSTAGPHCAGQHMRGDQSGPPLALELRL